MLDYQEAKAAVDANDGDDDGPARAALALAVGHLVEATVGAHRLPSHAAAADRLGFSRPRLSALVGLTALAPDIQTAVLALRVGEPLGNLSERTLFELCASRPAWNVQRWWWSLLAQPFEPDWLAEWVRALTAFPSQARARDGD
jgi:hypothetical protein